MHISNFSMGSDAGDINNDGWLDISVVDMVAEDNYRLKANMSGMNPDRFWQTVAKGGHYQYMFNTLQLNNGHTGDDQVIFSDIAQLTGTSNTDWSWSPLLADFDNNGHLDLFVTNGIKREMRNTDALAQMDSYIKTTIEKHKKNNSNNNEFDIWDLIELDSMLSFFPSQKLKNYIYANKGELEFEYVSDKWGLDQTSFSTGAAYGDLDNDGDLDLVVSNIDEEAFVYKNNTNENLTNNFLRIIIEGNGSYLGTRATVYYDNKLQMAELSGASGISSSSEDVLHFGLGENIVDSLKIDWFDGGSSMLRNVGIGVLKINPLKLEKKYKSVSTTIKRSQFEEVTEKRGINFIHKENRFDDYGREVLLPHRMSTMGSGLAVGDIDGNSLEDFFIGAAAGNKGQIYFQQKDGNFKASELSEFAPNLNFEDMGSALFDADLDGDLDLYIVSGGNEYAQGSEWQQDRFYVNEGKKLIAKTGVLPDLRTSGGRVKVGDYDKDGDLDLFVGGRQVPGRYPEPANSYILQNQWMESGRLSFITVAEFEKMGMVTDGVWTDYDVDGDLDLLVIGEWMEPTIIENKKGKFTQKKLELSIDNAVGWWYSLSSSDLDGDGDDDYILGNLGENYKYKATQEEPFTVHYDDFDANGSNDIVLGYYNYGEHFPLRGRSCSSQQIPDIKKQFTNYHEFAIASLKQVYGEASLDEALYYEAGIFSSICLENMGKGKFKVRRLPIEAQFSSINSSVIMDIDKDGVKDLIIVGNLFGAEIETPRNDAGLGLYLKGKGNCTFEPVPMHESGLRLPYDVKEIKKIQLTDGEGIVVAVNNGSMKLIKIK